MSRNYLTHIEGENIYDLYKQSYGFDGTTIGYIVDFLRNIDPGKSEISILDIGCGNGDVLLAALEKTGLENRVFHIFFNDQSTLMMSELHDKIKRFNQTNTKSEYNFYLNKSPFEDTIPQHDREKFEASFWHRTTDQDKCSLTVVPTFDFILVSHSFYGFLERDIAEQTNFSYSKKVLSRIESSLAANGRCLIVCSSRDSTEKKLKFELDRFAEANAEKVLELLTSQYVFFEVRPIIDQLKTYELLDRNGLTPHGLKWASYFFRKNLLVKSDSGDSLIKKLLEFWEENLIDNRLATEILYINIYKTLPYNGNLNYSFSDVLASTYRRTTGKRSLDLNTITQNLLHTYIKAFSFINSAYFLALDEDNNYDDIIFSTQDKFLPHSDGRIISTFLYNMFSSKVLYNLKNKIQFPISSKASILFKRTNARKLAFAFSSDDQDDFNRFLPEIQTIEGLNTVWNQIKTREAFLFNDLTQYKEKSILKYSRDLEEIIEHYSTDFQVASDALTSTYPVDRIEKKEVIKDAYFRFKNCFQGELPYSFESFCKYHFTISNIAYNEIRFIYFIPSKDTASGGDALTGFFFIIEKDSNTPENIQRQVIESLIADYNKIASVVNEKYNRVSIENQSRKAALSQVLNRNLSHHMGSHVLSQVVFMENYAESSYKLRLFHSYLRSRMDFLADVSTSLPTTTTRREFKRNILSGFTEQDIVLQYITGTNEDLSQEKSALFRTLKSGKFLHPEDLPVAIPNFNLGLHAFYVFLENTIRNAFKHSEHSAQNKSHGDFEITFDFEDYTADREYYKVTMWDNIPREEVYLKEVVLPKIDNLIEAPILKNGLLREDGWGLLEMKICCLYLRMLAAEKIDVLQSPSILKAITKTDGGQSFLGYEFYLLKPQLLYLINWTDEELNTPEKEKLNRYGIHVLDRKKAEGKIPVLLKQIPHEFFVFIGQKADEQKLYKQYPLVPHRRLFYFLDDAESNSKLSQLKALFHPENFQIDHLEKHLWRCWTQQLFPDYCPELVLSKADKEARKPRNLSQAIIFDRHGELINSDTGDYRLRELEQSIFYSWYGGSDESDKYNSWYEETGRQTGINWTDLSTQELELLEASIEVLIIDERIQKGTETEVHNSYAKVMQPKKERLRQMKIEVMESPQNDTTSQYCVDLNKRGRFSASEKQTIENWIKSHYHADKAQYLIIHLGIIEKLVGTEKDHIRDYLEFLKEQLFRSRNRQENPASFKKVVITTGRGKSDTMPPNVNFIAYSNIAKYLVEKTGKMSLIKGLMSARCVKYE